MTKPSTSTRAVLVALAVAIIATPGCSWFRKDDPLYAASAANRPLEVPPELDASGAGSAPATTSATASGTVNAAAAAQAASAGFGVPGTREDAFARVGKVLGGIAGVRINSSAQLLGVYDVDYDGANLLVRVAEGQGGMRVSVVDPRGLPATGDAPARLTAALKAALGVQ